MVQIGIIGEDRRSNGTEGRIQMNARKRMLGWSGGSAVGSECER